MNFFSIPESGRQAVEDFLVRARGLAFAFPVCSPWRRQSFAAISGYGGEHALQAARGGSREAASRSAPKKHYTAAEEAGLDTRIEALEEQLRQARSSAAWGHSRVLLACLLLHPCVLSRRATPCRSGGAAGRSCACTASTPAACPRRRRRTACWRSCSQSLPHTRVRDAGGRAAEGWLPPSRSTHTRNAYVQCLLLLDVASAAGGPALGPATHGFLEQARRLREMCERLESASPLGLPVTAGAAASNAADDGVGSASAAAGGAAAEEDAVAAFTRSRDALLAPKGAAAGAPAAGAAGPRHPPAAAAASASVAPIFLSSASAAAPAPQPSAADSALAELQQRVQATTAAQRPQAAAAH